MKQEKPMCWCCVWRDITGPDNDPTMGCGHTSAQIRRRFEGSSTAEYCKEYLEDDPELKLKIDRITRETLMKNIHQLVVTDGHYAAAEAIVDAVMDGPFLSKEDFRSRTKVSKTICDLMADLGLLGDLPESNQLSLFDLVS